MLFAPVLLTACSAPEGDNSSNGSTAPGASADQNAGAATGADEAGGDASTSIAAVNAQIDDATVDTCELNDQGAPEVTATITNTGDVAATFVASVDIKQGKERVDGVGLIANAVKAGDSAKASATGTKTGLEGEITCEVTGLEAVTG